MFAYTVSPEPLPKALWYAQKAPLGVELMLHCWPAGLPG